MVGEERKHWNRDIEPKLGTPEMKELQWTKLKEAIRWQYENTPLQKNTAS